MQSSTLPKGDKKILSAYGPKIKVQVKFEGKGRTKQAFKDDTDINKIIARFLRTGVMDFAQKNEPRYEDVTGADFTQAMRVVAHAKTMFEELPAKVRSDFENDPHLFLDFVQNPDNRAEAEKMGLLRPLPVPPAGEVSPQPEVAGDAATAAVGERGGKKREGGKGAEAPARPASKDQSST